MPFCLDASVQSSPALRSAKTPAGPRRERTADPDRMQRFSVSPSFTSLEFLKVPIFLSITYLTVLHSLPWRTFHLNLRSPSPLLPSVRHAVPSGAPLIQKKKNLPRSKTHNTHSLATDPCISPSCRRMILRSVKFPPSFPAQQKAMIPRCLAIPIQHTRGP